MTFFIKNPTTACNQSVEGFIHTHCIGTFNNKNESRAASRSTSFTTRTSSSLTLGGDDTAAAAEEEVEAKKERRIDDTESSTSSTSSSLPSETSNPDNYCNANKKNDDRRLRLKNQDGHGYSSSSSSASSITGSRGKYGLFVCSCFYTFFFVGSFFGWGPMQLMLEANGAFAWKCYEDTPPQDLVTVTTISSSMTSPFGFNDDNGQDASTTAICPAQTASLINVQLIASLAQLDSPLLGILMDHYGSKVMAFVMIGCWWSGLLLLVVSVMWHFDYMLYSAFLFLAHGMAIGALLIPQTATYFQQQEGGQEREQNQDVNGHQQNGEQQKLNHEEQSHHDEEVTVVMTSPCMVSSLSASATSGIPRLPFRPFLTPNRVIFVLNSLFDAGGISYWGLWWLGQKMKQEEEDDDKGLLLERILDGFDTTTESVIVFFFVISIFILAPSVHYWSIVGNDYDGNASSPRNEDINQVGVELSSHSTKDCYDDSYVAKVTRPTPTGASSNETMDDPSSKFGDDERFVGDEATIMNGNTMLGHDTCGPNSNKVTISRSEPVVKDVITRSVGDPDGSYGGDSNFDDGSVQTSDNDSYATADEPSSSIIDLQDDVEAKNQIVAHNVEKAYIPIASRTPLQQLASGPFVMIMVYFAIHNSANYFTTATTRDYLAYLGDDEFENQYLTMFTLLMPASLLALPFVDFITLRLGLAGGLQMVNLLGLSFLLIRGLYDELNYVQVIGFLASSFYRCFLGGVVFSFLPTLLHARVVGKAMGMLYMANGIILLINIPLASYTLKELDGNFKVPNLAYAAMLLPCIVLAWMLGRTLQHEKKRVAAKRSPT